MKFTKMHGCGNDYIYINCFDEQVDNPEELAKFVSDERFGIGSDGLILIKPSEVADFTMDMYNSDGSRGKMCGNGIRCVGKYVYDHKMTDKTKVAIETLSGIKYLDLYVENGKAVGARVDMGSPILEPEKIPVRLENATNLNAEEKKSEAVSPILEKEISVSFNGTDELVKISCVSMGNPHAIIYVEDAEAAPVHTLGPVMEHHPIFPERCNIEFCQVLSRSEVRMRVWERGSGETWACGTGACATAVACILNGKTDNKVTVHMNGGDVIIEYDREKNTVLMTGPAATVCEGELFC